jgi:Tfp pilus assembly protein PilF
LLATSVGQPTVHGSAAWPIRSTHFDSEGLSVMHMPESRFSLTTLVCAVAFAALSLGCSRSHNALERGNQLFEQKNYRGALVEYALLQTGQFEDGRMRAEKVLQKNPKNVRAQMLRAYGTAGLRDIESAIKDVRKALELDPTRADSYASLGVLELARGGRPGFD